MRTSKMGEGAEMGVEGIVQGRTIRRNNTPKKAIIDVMPHP